MLALLVALSLLDSPPTPSPAPGPIQELEEELRRRPDDGAVLYALAMFSDRLGQVGEALRWLERLAGSTWDAGLDPSDFTRTTEGSAQRFAELRASIDRRSPIVASAREVLRVRQRDLLPEGLEVDPGSGDYLLSSGRLRKVVRVSREGRVSDVVVSGQDGLLATLGLRVDRARGVLWVASAAAPFMVGASEVPAGLSRLHAFDLATGRLRARFELSGRSLLNDVSVLRDGRAVVTDSAGDGLLVTAGDRLEPLLPAGTLSSPNGVCTAADGRLLYVATFRGIFVVDWQKREASPLRLPPGSNGLAGIDGLYLHRGALLGIQNAVGRPRLVRVPLHADGRSGLRIEVLESGSPIVDNPTTGAVVGRQFVFLARRNRETAFLGPDGPPLEDIVLAGVPLR
jgi:hypothetical protein